MDEQLLEIKAKEIMNPINLFSSVEELVEFFKEGTEEEIQAAIKACEKVEWYEGCIELRKLIK